MASGRRRLPNDRSIAEWTATYGSSSNVCARSVWSSGSVLAERAHDCHGPTAAARTATSVDSSDVKSVGRTVATVTGVTDSASRSTSAARVVASRFWSPVDALSRVDTLGTIESGSCRASRPTACEIPPPVMAAGALVHLLQRPQVLVCGFCVAARHVQRRGRRRLTCGE